MPEPWKRGFDDAYLIGTLLAETPFRWHFAPEDVARRAFWLSKRYGAWEDDEPLDYDDGNPRKNHYPREGMMTLPRWIARKRRCIGEPPDDDDPAWIIIADLDIPYFRADSLQKKRPTQRRPR